MLRARPNAELTRLLNRLGIREKIAAGAHATNLVFVTNGLLDPAGRDYLVAAAGRHPPLEVWDQARLAPVAERTRRPELLPNRVVMSTSSPPATIERHGQIELAVGFVPAIELVNLPGIDDLSLFDRNVRLSEGRSRINRELAETISDAQEHAMFPAFHNGLTMLTHGLTVEDREIRLDGITVVNGCQSVLTLHAQRDKVT